MASFWSQFFASVGGTAVVVAIITFLGRTLIGQIMSFNLEDYKSALTKERELLTSQRQTLLEEFKSDLQRELEQFKDQLQVAAKENEIRFSRLHEKRAEILAELFGQLSALDINSMFLADIVDSTGPAMFQEQLDELHTSATTTVRGRDAVRRVSASLVHCGAGCR